MSGQGSGKPLRPQFLRSAALGVRAVPMTFRSFLEVCDISVTSLGLDLELARDGRREGE